jgi:hypothetical protein
MVIFLDESGDLGFDFSKKGTNHTFTIALLVCNDNNVARSIRKAVERTLKNKMNRKLKRIAFDELKGNQVPFKTLEYFYRQLPDDGWCLFALVLNKERVYPELRSAGGKKKLYNYLTRQLLEKVGLKDAPSVLLIMDRCKNGEDIKDCNRYMTDQMAGYLSVRAPFDIHHQDSKQDKGIQAVDLFCWGIHRKYEHNDEEWYRLYKEKIRYETVYLPPN